MSGAYAGALDSASNNHQPTPITRASEADMKTTRRELDKLLEGVGAEDQTDYIESDSAFHLMRPPTPEDIAGLPLHAHAPNN
jgi:hypothetical protein